MMIIWLFFSYIGVYDWIGFKFGFGEVVVEIVDLYWEDGYCELL